MHGNANAQSRALATHQRHRSIIARLQAKILADRAETQRILAMVRYTAEFALRERAREELRKRLVRKVVVASLTTMNVVEWLVA